MNYCNKTVYVVGGGHIACFDNRRESRNRYYFPYYGGLGIISRRRRRESTRIKGRHSWLRFNRLK